MRQKIRFWNLRTLKKGEKGVRKKKIEKRKKAKRGRKEKGYA